MRKCLLEACAGKRPSVEVRARAQVRGISLIEVLVSIIVASIGLLALAAVNAAALRYSKMTQYRAVATQMASDIADRMRANKGTAAGGFIAGSYDLTSSFSEQATPVSLPEEPCTVICTAAQIAALDLAQWRISLREQLPEGSAYLAKQDGQLAADVWVVWRDPSVANTDEGPAAATECPNALSRGDDKTIRCSYFRINL
jgi:type IV pilus assembly protein PilV